LKKKKITFILTGTFSHASDCWSFGVVLWEMFSLGMPPFGDMKGVDVIAQIEKGHRLPKPDLCPDETYELMKNCWNYQPRDRPSFKYLMEKFSKDPDYQNIVLLIESNHIS
jgi:serine/threonine protein kinase